MRRHRNKHFCMCGCGELIEVKRPHYRTGVPKFLKGHNFDARYNPQVEGADTPPTSTWDALSEKEKAKRLKNLKPFPKGEEHPGWNCGVSKTTKGYLHQRLPDHPFCVNDYVPQHRWVCEQWVNDSMLIDNRFFRKIGDFYYLEKNTVVHHRDEVKVNNIINNLVVFDCQSNHAKWHNTPCSEEEKFDIFKDSIFCPWLNLGQLPPGELGGLCPLGEK